MQTDIRVMVEGLRPVADFEAAVERTISVLNTRLAERGDERGELAELAEFWSAVLEGMRS